MVAFWVVAGVLSALAAGLILFRAARAASTPEVADPTPVLYRRQLAEIDELADRGLLAETERKSAHAEAARRLLAASGEPAQGWTTSPSRGGVMLAVALVPALALALYLVLGAPGVPDQPFAKRLQTWRATDLERLQPAELAAVLERVAKDRPNDPELFRYIAIAENAAQNPAAAVRALHRAVTLAPERADLWTSLGEATAFRDGKVGPEAEEAFNRALKLDPTSASARYYLARAQVDRGDKAGGVAAWQKLLADLPQADERRSIVLQSIAQAQAAPDTPSIAGEQMAAIRGMVAGLADRLKQNPDDAEGWVRLVRAYAVLNQPAERDAALKTAKARYAGRPDILNQLTQAAAAEPMK